MPVLSAFMPVSPPLVGARLWAWPLFISMNRQWPPTSSRPGHRGIGHGSVFKELALQWARQTVSRVKCGDGRLQAGSSRGSTGRRGSTADAPGREDLPSTRGGLNPQGQIDHNRLIHCADLSAKQIAPLCDHVAIAVTPNTRTRQMPSLDPRYHQEKGNITHSGSQRYIFML